MRLTKKMLVTILALGILAGRKQDAADQTARRDLYVGAAQHQIDYLESKSKRRIVTGGRRSGKTEAFVIELVAVAARGGRALYLSLTQTLAEETIWERVKERLRRVGLKYVANEAKLTIRVAGGGLIKLGGMKDKKEVDKHRGKAWALVIVDECGAQPSALLKYLVQDSIGPTLRDYEGQLTLGGTPPPVLTGYWCDQAGPDRSSKAPRWEWTIFDNPFFAGREERVLADVREENEWGEDCVTYRREYLGEWVQDEGTLVYPYLHARNGVAALPERTPKGYPVSPSRWRHVIGVDVGTTKDAMAIVVLTAHPALKGEFMVHAEAHTKMTTDGLVGRLRALLRRFPHATIALDSGGMGAAHALEVSAAGLPIVAAKKTEKASAIRVLHDRVIGGRFKLLAIPSTDGVRKEWASLGWDDDHLQHHPDQSDHYSDATLYALRELRHYSTREDMEKPPKDLRAEDDDEDDDVVEVEKPRPWLQRVTTFAGEQLGHVLGAPLGVAVARVRALPHRGPRWAPRLAAVALPFRGPLALAA